MLQPAASERRVITNRLCTPPSGDPSRLRTKRASRTGPLAVTNGGTTFFAPIKVATVTCGFVAGLVPPIVGWEWHPEQLSRLNLGPPAARSLRWHRFLRQSDQLKKFNSRSNPSSGQRKSRYSCDSHRIP